MRILKTVKKQHIDMKLDSLKDIFKCLLIITIGQW